MKAIDHLTSGFTLSISNVDEILEETRKHFKSNVGINGVIAHIRHKYSNYESLIRSRLMKPYQYVMFKDYVNNTIRKELKNVFIIS